MAVHVAEWWVMLPVTQIGEEHAEQGAHQHILPVVLVVTGPGDGNEDSAEEWTEEDTESPGAPPASGAETVQLSPKVQCCEAKACKCKGGMAAGEALPPLHDCVRVTTALQLSIELPVREAAVEEIWPWSANSQLDSVGENSVKDQRQGHS